LGNINAPTVMPALVKPFLQLLTGIAIENINI
jgi:hypothetical protein